MTTEENTNDTFPEADSYWRSKHYLTQSFVAWPELPRNPLLKFGPFHHLVKVVYHILDLFVIALSFKFIAQ